MVRLVTGEVKACKPPSSPGPADVGHYVIGRTSMAYRSEQKRAPPRVLKRDGRRSMRHESLAGAMDHSSVIS